MFGIGKRAGSILGPLIFSVFINDIQQCVIHGMLLYCLPLMSKWRCRSVQWMRQDDCKSISKNVGMKREESTAIHPDEMQRDYIETR